MSPTGTSSFPYRVAISTVDWVRVMRTALPSAILTSASSGGSGGFFLAGGSSARAPTARPPRQASVKRRGRVDMVVLRLPTQCNESAGGVSPGKWEGCYGGVTRAGRCEPPGRDRPHFFFGSPVDSRRKSALSVPPEGTSKVNSVFDGSLNRAGTTSVPAWSGLFGFGLNRLIDTRCLPAAAPGL